MMKKLGICFVGIGLIVASAAEANSLIEPKLQAKIARSSLSARPSSEWNRLSYRGGRNVEIWTIDGDELNKIVFYGGIGEGKTLFREADKKNSPLPRVTPNMLITDIPVLLENSYRIQHATVQMTIDSMEAATVGGHAGVKFTYTYIRRDDEVVRKGEAVGAIVGKSLYLVTYEAPQLHFFDKDLEKFRQIIGTLKI